MLQAFQGERSRRAARAVQGDHLALGGIIEQGEAVPADARGGRFGHIEGGGGRHGRVGSVAARGQDLQARGHGERLRGGDHAASAVDMRTAGVKR